MKNIRNFSIIAHINHGKSTLSDRIIQICGGLADCKMQTQILDSMDLERERGITIKARSVMLNYSSLSGGKYHLNFIDTPGHVDFSYEVSRSLAACEGALLVVDAGQGIEAQTLANYYTAIDMGMKIVPIINKIDLPNINPDHIIREMKNIIGIDTTDVVRCSAKTGFGVIDVLERLVKDIPPPEGKLDDPLQVLIIDSWFDNYQGVVSLVRIKNGIMRKGDKIKVMSTGIIYNVDRLGIFTPKQIDLAILKCGEVGWLVCAIKDIFAVPVGDTLTAAQRPAKKALLAFKKVKPQVYASLFPVDSKDYKSFRNALYKLSLNDASLCYEQENSSVLGFGFRCGFLGLLHMEIIQERLEREYNLSLIITAPMVVHEVLMINKEVLYVDSPHNLPDPSSINELREPIAQCHIFLPQEYLGNIITLCVEKRGVQIDMIYHDKQVELIYEIPLAEIVFDFFDRLKSASCGYASLDYDFKRFQVSKVVCINVLINGMRIDPLALITHKDNALYRGRALVRKIKDLIPRQQFDVVVQAAIGSHIIARSTIKELRKNVVAKCYGGDVSRKKKLLQKQKIGKKRMKQVGNVKLPTSVFLTVLQVNKMASNHSRS